MDWNCEGSAAWAGTGNGAGLGIALRRERASTVLRAAWGVCLRERESVSARATRQKREALSQYGDGREVCWRGTGLVWG